jgi:hypothetical protein
MTRTAPKRRADPDNFARNIAATVPIATLPDPSFAPLAAPCKAR